jgi:hypothetical protein
VEQSDALSPPFLKGVSVIHHFVLFFEVGQRDELSPPFFLKGVSVKHHFVPFFEVGQRDELSPPFPKGG